MRTARASRGQDPRRKRKVVSPTAMTISRMASKISTEPWGPPIPMAYFLSLRRTPPPGLARPLLWVDRQRRRNPCSAAPTPNQRSSRTQRYGAKVLTTFMGDRTPGSRSAATAV